jgi:hypothetical protein
MVAQSYAVQAARIGEGIDRKTVGRKRGRKTQSEKRQPQAVLENSTH